MHIATTPSHDTTSRLPRRDARFESSPSTSATELVLNFAAWDVHRATQFGTVVDRLSIAGFELLVAQVMRRAPYRTARRVFWIVDNGTIHRGRRAIERLQARWRNLILVHLPIHASWLLRAGYSIARREHIVRQRAELRRIVEQYVQRHITNSGHH